MSCPRALPAWGGALAGRLKKGHLYTGTRAIPGRSCAAAGQHRTYL